MRMITFGTFFFRYFHHLVQNSFIYIQIWISQNQNYMLIVVFSFLHETKRNQIKFNEFGFFPISSFDVRGRPLDDAQHWSAPETFGSRARFNADVDPAVLDIKVSHWSIRIAHSRTKFRVFNFNVTKTFIFTIQSRIFCFSLENEIQNAN